MKVRLIPPMILLLGVASLILFHVFLPQYNLILFPFNLTGIIIAISGFTIMGKARDIFKIYQTTLGYQEPAFLVKEGIFSKSRNPMYLGMIFLLVGIGISFQTVGFILVSTLFFLYFNALIIPKEERLMHQTFGGDYLDYKKKVRKWF